MPRTTTVLARLTAGVVAAAVLIGLLGVSSPQPVTAAVCSNGWKEANTPESVFLSTAFDIVTQGVANPGSLLAAIRLAARMARTARRAP